MFGEKNRYVYLVRVPMNLLVSAVEGMRKLGYDPQVLHTCASHPLREGSFTVIETMRKNVVDNVKSVIGLVAFNVERKPGKAT